MNAVAFTGVLFAVLVLVNCKDDTLRFKSERIEADKIVQLNQADGARKDRLKDMAFIVQDESQEFLERKMVHSKQMDESEEDKPNEMAFIVEAENNDFYFSEAISLDETDGIQTDDVHDMAFVIDVRSSSNILKQLTRPSRRNVGKCYSKWDCGSQCYCASNNYCCCPWHSWC